jgi:hypothetical protein
VELLSIRIRPKRFPYKENGICGSIIMFKQQPKKTITGTIMTMTK